MIEFLEPIVIPNVGSYNAGAKVTLEDELEEQLVASGKAVRVKSPDEKESRVVDPVHGFQRSHADDD